VSNARDELPARLRWHEHLVLPPYRDDPQDEITMVLRDPSFYDRWGDTDAQGCEYLEGDHDGLWVRYRCITHDQVYLPGGLDCPDHVAHEIALECEAHGLEGIWPQPLMLAKPAGFDPPLTARQLDLAAAGYDDD
jgi:hypothetical protein